MTPRKIILLCSGRFALPVLRDLVFFNMIGAVVIPEHSADTIEQVKLLLQGTGIPVLTVNKKNYIRQLTDLIHKESMEMGLIATFSFKIPKEVFSLPARGFFNIHPGALPGYRGSDPIFRQIKNKEEYAAVTIHKLDEGYDTGPVVMSEKIKIQKNDTHGLLTSKLSELAARLCGVLMKLSQYSQIIPAKGQDESKAVYHPKQTAKDITIDWDNMDADSIIALINACNPWNKGAVTKLNSMIIRLLHAEKIEYAGSSYKPGTIVNMDNTGITISCSQNEFIFITFIYMDEGYIHASRIAELGIAKGSSFQPC